MFNKNFLSFFLGQLSAHLGDAFIQIAIIAMLLAKLEKSGSVMALIVFFVLLPSLILSPFAGVWADKFSRKKIMIISSVYRLFIASGYVLLLVSGKEALALNVAFVYAISFLIGIGTAVFYPAKMAFLPEIVSPKNLKSANALVSGSGTLAVTAGAIIAGAIINSYGTFTCFEIDVALFAFSAILLAFVKAPISSVKSDSVSAQNMNELKNILGFLAKHKRTVDMLLLAVVLSLISATFFSSMNAIGADVFNMSAFGLTKLKGYIGVGAILGMLLTLVISNKIKLHKLLTLSFLGLSLVFVTAGFCNTHPKAMVWLGFAGIFSAILLISVDTILQKVTPNGMRGKVFAVKSMLATAATLAGTLAVSFGLELDISALFMIKVIAYACFAIGAFIILFDKDFRYFMLKSTLGLLFLCLFRYKAEGLENIPKNGKIILAGNHTGHLDPFIIQMAINRHLWFVTGPVAFTLPVIKHLLKYYNVLPLKFGQGVDAIEAAVKKLVSGEAVVIFPEGKFTRDGNLCKFNRGVGLMAKHADCPIIPFAIQGGFESWGHGRKLPKLFGNIVIQFGQPITHLDKSDKDIAQELKERVNFMKHSLERRAKYKITDKSYSNFLDIMQEKSDIYGQVKALSIKNKEGYEELSYIELSRGAKNLSIHLIEQENVQRGDRIAMICESRPEFGYGIFASIQTGAITVPLDIKLTVAEHTHILNDCKPRFLLCSSHYLEHALEVQKNVDSIEKIFVLDDEEREHPEIMSISSIKSDTEKAIGRPRSLDETALIVYTSGTTGNPKGVMISFGNIYSQLRDFEKILKLSHDNTLLSILPLNHLLELNVGFFGMLYMGAKIVYIKSLNPKELTTVMKEKQITNMMVVPLVAKMLKNSIEKQIKKQPKFAQNVFSIMYKLAKFAPLCVKRLMFKSVIDGLGGKFQCFVCGGAPLENDVAEFFDRIGIPAFQGYGLTETSPVISTNCYGRNKIGTVGRPLDSVKVKIAENGEILCQGSNVMQGYYGRPEATAEVIDEDGWFHTGDIGEIDSQGFIKITGRIKNMIVLGGGKKIFPEEVESVLETSKLIKEVCVMSVKIKSGNKAGTEEVGAVIVPADDIAKKSDEELQSLLENEVKELSAKNLASYKAPTAIILHRDELPKTSTRKVKRKVLLEWYENSYVG